MKFTLSKLLVLVALAASPALFAHGDHCHKKGADGKLSDWKGIKDQADCEKQGGAWRDHHDHCHKAGADGKAADFSEGKNKQECVAKGGRWTDHGHEGLAD